MTILVLTVLLGILPPALQAQATSTPPASATSAEAQANARDQRAGIERLRFASGLSSRGFHDMAAEEYQAFLRDHPDHANAPEAFFGLIRSRRAQGQLEPVLAGIRQFQQRWPNHELARKLDLWRGEALLQQGKLQKAEEAFKRLLGIKDSVTREAAFYFLAQSTARRGKATKAVALYRKLAGVAFDEDHVYRPYAVYAIGAHAAENRQFDEAETAFLRLVEGDPVPPSLQEEALFRLGQVFFERKQYAEAIVQFESLLVEFPEGRFARTARKRRVWAHYQLGNHERAAELAKQWQQKHAETFDAKVLFIQAASLMNQRKHSEAQTLFRNLALSAEAPRVYRKTARYQQIFCLLKLERYEEAENQATQFAEDFPDATEQRDVGYFRARALTKTGHHEAAVDVGDSLLEDAPLDWPYRDETVETVAESLAELDRSERLAQTLRREARAGGKNAAEWLLRAAETARENEQFPQAIQDLETLLKTFPEAKEEVTAATLYLAELYSLERQFDRAETLVRKLLETHDTRSIRGRLHYLLGYLYGQQQRYKMAEEQLTAALETGAGTALRGDTQAYLVYVLLQQDKTGVALERFAEILDLPVEERPDVRPDLLFRLERIYYRRDRYQICEQLSLWLRENNSNSVRFRAGIRLAELHIATQRLDVAEEMLLRLRDETREHKANLPEYSTATVSSMMGEISLLKGENDRAVTAFDKALSTQTLPREFATRARWGMAEVLRREGRTKQALHYAMNAFILGDDPVYTPRAMFLAIDILVPMDRKKEAATTWRELKQRFPAFAARKEQADAILKLQPAAEQP